MLVFGSVAISSEHVDRCIKWNLWESYIQYSCETIGRRLIHRYTPENERMSKGPISKGRCIIVRGMKSLKCPIRGFRSWKIYMDVSENRGTPKSSILIGFSIINHPFWGTHIFGNTHIITTPNSDPWTGQKLAPKQGPSWPSHLSAQIFWLLKNPW